MIPKPEAGAPTSGKCGFHACSSGSVLFLQRFHSELFWPQDFTSPISTDELQMLHRFTGPTCHPDSGFHAPLHRYLPDSLSVSETSFPVSSVNVSSVDVQLPGLTIQNYFNLPSFPSHIQSACKSCGSFRDILLRPHPGPELWHFSHLIPVAATAGSPAALLDLPGHIYL